MSIRHRTALVALPLILISLVGCSSRGFNGAGAISTDTVCQEASCGDGADSHWDEPAEIDPRGGGIAWDEAISHAGSVQRVCGPFAGGGYSTDDVFLNLGRDYPDPERFTIVLWDVGGVETLPTGTTLCAEGAITLYEGVAQIELRDAGLVEIWE